MREKTYEQQTAERFVRDTAGHKLTVLHDDGLYRHLRFKSPKRSMYWFDLVTTPGVLTIRGDCGTFVFSRLTDMFEFFRGKRVNPHYWAQKEQSGTQTEVYSEDVFRRWVWTYVRETGRGYRGLAKSVQEDIFNTGYAGHESSAREALDDFAYQGFFFGDTWEVSFKDWDWEFLWCCHAVVEGIRQYDAHRARQEKRRIRRWLSHPKKGV